MKQSIKKTKGTTSKASADLQAQFTKVKGRETDAVEATRVVKLKYKSCCGCGCDWITIRRTVPVNSPFKDGDIAKDMEDGDL